MSPAVTPCGIDSSPQPTGVWRHALGSALHVDWASAEPLAALRCTIGVGVPLLLALLAGQPAAGMFVAVGAVSAGFGSFQGAYRSRAATMLFAVGGMALSLTVGSLAGHSDALATLVTAAWGLGTGLLVSLGAAASFVALQSTVALIVAVAYPAAPMEALGRGLLVLGGGLVQVVLVVSVWPLRRFGAERSLVARIYRSLADYAGDLPAGHLLPPEPHTLAGSPPVDADPHPFARSSDVLVFRGLFDEAERIRASLAALSLSPAREDPLVAGSLAAIIREIAAAVDQGRAPAPLHAQWDALDRLAANHRLRSALDRLLSQLRAACRMATVPAAGDQPDGDAVRRRSLPPVRQAIVTLAANLSMRSTGFRHALRLATALAIATAFARGYALPRGYWFPMTALLVLKPEFRETYVTGITRGIGTLVGAGLATLLVAMVGSEPAEVTVLLLVFVWAGYALFRASYTAFTVCITGYVVLLLYLAHAPAPATATYRAIDTVLGGALALAIFRAWPTWEARRLPDVIAHQADMLARYTDVLIGSYVEPASWDAKRLAQVRSDARLARSNSEASVERVLGEPVGGRGWNAALALGVLAALRRYALGALALHAGLDERPAQPVRALAPVRACLVERLHLLSAVLRGQQSSEGLASACQPVVSEPAVGASIAAQTELLVESIDNVAELLLANARERHPDGVRTDSDGSIGPRVFSRRADRQAASER